MIDEEVERLAYEATERGDYDVAVRLLEPLADSDSLYALTTLGWIYQYGPKGFTNNDLASKYYKRAIAIGSAKTRVDLGLLLISERKFSEARAILETYQCKGDKDFSDALNFLTNTEADFFAYEAMERKDYKKAFDFLQSQKLVDSEYTLLALGWLYQTGRAGITDNDQARSLYKQAVEVGSIDAHFRIGKLELAQGNDEAARAAFQNGADLAHSPAITKLGEMMVEGKGGPKDVEQGMKFLTAIAEQGHVMAKIKLLEINYRKEKNIIKKILLRIKSYIIFKGAIIEAKKKSRSENIYEFY